MIVRPLAVLVVLLIAMTGCSGSSTPTSDTGTGTGTGTGTQQLSSARMDSLLVARSKTAVPASWNVTKESDGPKNNSAEELFFKGTDLVTTLKVVLSSSPTTTAAAQDQSLNVAVDKRLLQHPQVTTVRVRTRTGSVTAEQVSGFDKTLNHAGTHVEFTVGSIVVSVLGSNDSLALQVARAQAATLPPAH